jgi:hypothetical protein
MRALSPDAMEKAGNITTGRKPAPKRTVQPNRQRTPRDFDTLIHFERLGKEAIAVPKVSLSGVWLGGICMIGNDRTLKTAGMGMGDLGAHLRPVADWYSNEGP